MKKLVMPYTKDALRFKNQVVVAPMRRSRALNNVPNESMVTYYKQRSYKTDRPIWWPLAEASRLTQTSSAGSKKTLPK